MKPEIIEIHKDLAKRAIRGMRRNRFANMEAAIYHVTGESVPNFPEGTNFRVYVTAFKHLIDCVREWTENTEIIEQVESEIKEYAYLFTKE